MRTRDRTKVRAAGSDDAVRVIGLENRADRDRCDARLVADSIGERRLVHPPVYRFGVRDHLARRTIHQVRPRRLEQPRDGNRVIGVDAPFCPVMRGYPHADRLFDRPHRADCCENFERVSAAASKITTVFVFAPIGQRRNETRKEITVSTMQLEPVETRLRGTSRRGYEIGLDPREVLPRGLARSLRHASQILLRTGGYERPIVLRQRSIFAASPGDAGRTLRPRVTELHRDLGVGPAMNESDDSPPCVALRIVPQARAAGRDPRIGGHAGHLGTYHPGAAQSACTEMDEMVIAGNAIY